jgi:hypothetical protein
MEIKLDLKSDSDNTYCDNNSLNIIICAESVILKLQSPDRKIVVDREDFKKVLSLI